MAIYVKTYYFVSSYCRLVFNSKICTDNEISRKKQPSPIIKLVIAKINKIETARDGLISTTAPTNNAPITIATNSAETVHSVIAQCTQTARTDSTVSSRACLGKSGFCASLSALYLSTKRPNHRLARHPISGCACVFINGGWRNFKRAHRQVGSLGR